MKIIARKTVDGFPTETADLSECFDIRFGEGDAIVSVSVRDGWIEIHAGGGRRLNLQPVSPNIARLRIGEFGE